MATNELQLHGGSTSKTSFPIVSTVDDLSTLFQFDSVLDNYSQFMAIANGCYNLPTVLLLSLFLSRLHVAIRGNVIAEAPSTMTSAVLIAMCIEDERLHPSLLVEDSCSMEEIGDSKYAITQGEDDLAKSASVDSKSDETQPVDDL
jgi:hypothetical protein